MIPVKLTEITSIAPNKFLVTFLKPSDRDIFETIQFKKKDPNPHELFATTYGFKVVLVEFQKTLLDSKFREKVQKKVEKDPSFKIHIYRFNTPVPDQLEEFEQENNQEAFSIKAPIRVIEEQVEVKNREEEKKEEEEIPTFGKSYTLKPFTDTLFSPQKKSFKAKPKNQGYFLDSP